MSDITEAGFEALKAAVHVAKDRQIKTVRMLRCAMKELGFDDAVISEALSVWSAHVRRGGT